MTSLLLALLCSCGGADPEPTDAPATGLQTTGDTAGSSSPQGLDGVQVVAAAEEGAESPWLLAGPEPGSWYAAFVRRDDDGYHRVWVATSSDDGATWAEPVVVSQPDDDVQSRWPDGPSLALGDDRLVVGYIAAERSGYLARVVQTDLALGAPAELTTLPMPPEYHSLSYATVVVDDEGQAMVALIAAPFLDGELWMARERHGWSLENVTATSPLEVPCECCPPAVHVLPDGSLVAAWRGDVAKEIYLAYGSATGPFERFEQATASGVRGELCPLDGPQLVPDGDDVAIAWSDASTTGPRMWFTRRGAAGWAHEAVAPSDGSDQSRVAVGGVEGQRSFAWESGTFQPYRWAEEGEIRGDDVDVGAGPLYEVRMVTDEQGAARGLGVDAEGGLWFVRFP